MPQPPHGGAGPALGWRHLIRAPWLAPRPALATPARARDLYLAGLVSARAMEDESICLLTHQIDRLSGQPDMQDALRRHFAESERQYERLGFLLEDMGVRTPPESGAEPEAALGGWEPALPLGSAELLEMAIVIDGFEHREATFYHALLQPSRLARHGHGTELLHRSLDEEERMASWARKNLDAIARAMDGPTDREAPAS